MVVDYKFKKKNNEIIKIKLFLKYPIIHSTISGNDNFLTESFFLLLEQANDN